MTTWFACLTPDEQRDAIARLNTPQGKAALDYAGGGQANVAFAAFLAEADCISFERYGLSIFDLPDYLWRDSYDNEMSPTEAVADAIATAAG